MVERGRFPNTASLLRELLKHQDSYRQRWFRRAVRGSQGINRAAVARVVMDFLDETGERRAALTSSRQLKDLIGRALSGRSLSQETLGWIIAAFEMEPEHESLVRRTFWDERQGSEDRIVIGRGLSAVGSTPRHHITRQLHEFHSVGSRGLPTTHRTIHVIEALDDGLDRYPYLFDTNEVEVTAVRGGSAGPVYRYNEHLHAVDITFPTSLKKGEIAYLDYETRFKWRETPLPEFRRAATRRVEGIELRVEFHRQKLPRKVWWAIWDDIVGPVREEKEIPLNNEFAVHEFLKVVDGVVVGFRWEW